MSGNGTGDRRRSERYAAMRAKALATTAAEAGQETAGGDVFGAMVDVGLSDGATITLVSLANGKTALYTSDGGGIAREDEHPRVEKYTQLLVKAAAKAAKRFKAGWEDRDLKDGEVRMIVLTPSGSRAVTAMGDDLAEDDHPLTDVFGAANEVIFHVRMAGD